MTETAVAPGIDRRKLAELKEREDAAFIDSHAGSIERWNQAKTVMPNGVPMSWLRTSYDHPPLFVAEGKGGHFRDVDGNDYADFNIADMSMFGGYGPEPVVEAVAKRMAAGSQFLLPSEDSIWVAQELQRRFGLPKWQFTLSATHANTEAIRVARTIPGETGCCCSTASTTGISTRPWWSWRTDGSSRGGGPAARRHVEDHDRAVQRRRGAEGGIGDARDRDRAHRARPHEQDRPAAAGRGLPRRTPRDDARTGTLLAYDETHTQVVGPGGLTRMWGLEPDIVSVGKSLAGGIPMGTYGMTDAVADVLERPSGRDDEKPSVATGGTLFGNPLPMASARATMGEVLTDQAYAHTHTLGAQLADGIEATMSTRPDCRGPPTGSGHAAASRSPSDAAQRARGPRQLRRTAAAADARLSREPRHLGRDRRRRADVRRSRNGGRCRRLRRRVLRPGR